MERENYSSPISCVMPNHADMHDVGEEGRVIDSNPAEGSVSDQSHSADRLAL